MTTAGVARTAAKRDRYHTSMAATFAVASELSRRGYDVGITIGNTPRIDLICSVPDGRSFKVQVKGASDKNYCIIQKAFFEAPEQEDLFLIVVLVPLDNSSGIRFFVLSHSDAIGEWRKLPGKRKDGAPYAEGTEGGLYWRNIEHHENKWEKLPQIVKDRIGSDSVAPFGG